MLVYYMQWKTQNVANAVDFQRPQFGVYSIAEKKCKYRGLSFLSVPCACIQGHKDGAEADSWQANMDVKPQMKQKSTEWSTDLHQGQTILHTAFGLKYSFITTCVGLLVLFVWQQDYARNISEKSSITSISTFSAYNRLPFYSSDRCVRLFVLDGALCLSGHH